MDAQGEIDAGGEYIEQKKYVEQKIKESMGIPASLLGKNKEDEPKFRGIRRVVERLLRIKNRIWHKEH